MEKRKREKIIFCWKAFLSSGLICLLILFISSSAFPQKKRISIGGSQAGGTHYPLAIGFAEIINRFLTDYNAIALETQGVIENIRLLGKGEIDIAIGGILNATQGYKGEKPFTTPLKNIRFGFYLNTPVFHIVTLESSKIKTMEDLKGKVVSVGTAGSAFAITMDALLRVHNISKNDLKIRYLPPDGSMEALSDGLIDAAVIYSAIPSPSINSLAVRKKIRLVNADEKTLKAVIKQEMMLCYFVQPGTYKGQDEGAFAWAQPATTFYNETADTMDVYKWTKTIIEHKDILQKVHPLGKEVRLLNKEELDLSPIPLHSGVIKCAKEAGISY